jgi:ligand-binding sensor domain-containing protein
VVVTSMFEDWGNSHGQSTIQGRSIIRDLITWTKNPDLEIPEYNLRDNPDPEVNLNLELKNISDASASKAKILWLDPDKNLAFEEEKSVSIPCGEEITIPVSHTFSGIPDSKLGIWHIDYILYDSEGDEIQPQAETDSGRFSLSRPPTELFEVSDLAANITVSNEDVCWGSQVSFQAHFTNRAAKDKRLHLWWDYTHCKAEYWGEVVIPADSTLTEEITIVAPYSRVANFWLHIFEENGEGIYSSLRSMYHRGTSVEPWTYAGSANKGFRIITPSVELNAQTDKDYYKKGETVNTTLTLKSLVHLPFDLIINSKVKDPFNWIVYEYPSIKHIEANESIQENVNFLLPPDARLGRYLIHIVAILPHPSLSYEKRIKRFKAFFDVIETKLKSNVIVPSVFQPNSSNTVSFDLTNIGLVEVSDGYVELKLSDPEGELVFHGQKNFSLPLGQSTTLSFDILLPEIKFGNYKLTYTVFDGEKISRLIEKVIPSKVSMNVAFDKDSYRMRDDMNIDLGAINNGKFVEDLTLNLKIPSLEYEDTRNFTLNPLQEQDFSFSKQVPTNIGSILHPLEVTLSLPSGSELKRTLNLIAVPESNLVVTSDKEDYSAGEDLEFKISNSGGMDALFSYEVKLSDLKHGRNIYQSSGNGVALAGGITPLTFTIPSQSVNGDYYLKVKAIDSSNNRKSELNKQIFISGLKADLEVKTDREIYLNTEDITLLSKVFNFDKEIVEGKISLQVVELKKWKHYSNAFVDGVISIAVDEENSIWFGTRKGVVKFDGTNWTIYNTSNSGLAHNYVRSIAVDKLGNLWSGTGGGGASKFDGNNWITYKTSSSGLVSNYIYAIAEDQEGNIWFGTYSGVSKFDGTTWTAFNTSNSRLASNQINSIAVDQDGNLWFGTNGKGVSKFDGTNWATHDTSNSGLANNYVRTIVADQEGNLWFGFATSGHGVSKFDGTNWESYDTSNSGLENDRVQRIAVDQQGNLWFATWGGGVSKLDVYGNWITYNTSNSGLRDDCLGSIAADKEGNIWIGTWHDYEGVIKFDGINWTSYESSNVGWIGKNKVNSSTRDQEGNLWFGTSGGGASKFDGTSLITYDTSNSGLVSNYVNEIATDLDGNLWLGTSVGANKFHGTDWSTYDTSNSELASNYIYAIAEDMYGNMWFGTSGGGASRFDGTNWITYNTSNSGLGSNSVYEIATDLDGNLWLGTSGGVSKFDGTDWSTYDTSNSELVNNYVRAIAIDLDGNIWLGTYSGVSKFDGTTWTAFNTSNSGLPNDRINSIVLDPEGNIWFGTDGGASKFNGTNWITYDPSNSELVDDVNSIAIDLDGNKWFGTDNGISMLVGGGGRGVPLWQKDFSISQAANQTQEFTENIGKLDYTGKLYLEGKLLSSTGQLISETEYPFYVTESSTVLVFSPDKTVYRQSETVSIQGEVKNLAPVEASGLILTIQKRSAEPGSEPEDVYNETFNVPAGGAHSFSFTLASDEEGTYILTGVVTQNTDEVANASEQYQVSNPHIKATVSAPDVVGLNPFDISIELENTGLIEGTVTISIQPSGFSEEVIVPPEEKKLVTSTQQIVQTTGFEINITGDCAETVTKDVFYGLGAEISVTPHALYPEGRVEIPVKVTNTGLLENQVGIDFMLSLNGTQAAQLPKSYYLPVGQFVEDTLGFDLIAGIYTLSWSSLYGAAQMSFEVRPLEQMEMTAALGTQTEGVFPLNVNLTNAGFDDFSGSVSVESEIHSSFQEVTLASGSSNLFIFSIIPEGIAEGEYNLLVKLLRLDNTAVREQTVSLAVTKPQFALTSVPTGLSFSTGEDASFPFTLKNTGSQEGRASLKVEVMDMESAEDLYLGAGQEKDLSFAFLVPYDLPQGYYVGKYTLAQEGAPLPLQGEFRFNVQGIDIDVEAQLDKGSYTEGETALLTLTVTNNSGASIDLFAKVNYRDYEGEQSFTLEASSFLDFNIPLPEITEEKVFYGIYHRDGRGIHLNDIYIYKKEEGVEVLTDKQVYYPGETVNIQISSPGAGSMRIDAPGYEDEFTIDGSTSKSFTLPSDLLGGTYGVSWSFFSSDEGGSFSGVRLFDVAGLKVVVTDASLDKPRYSPGDTIQARIVFESNQDVSALMKLWIINPEGDLSDAGSTQISLSSAEHTIATQSTSFDSSCAGMHRLVYALYTPDDKLIVSGSEAFDCGGGVVLGVSTEKRDYPLATEEVKTFVSLFGDGEAPLALYIDDEQIKTMTVALSGVTMEEIVLQSSLLDPGTLSLRAELQKDNLLSKKDTSFNYGSSLPDLTLTGLTYESEALTFTIRADAVNQGLENSSATSIAFYEGDPDEGGAQFGTAGIGGLDAGESSGVEIQWSGLGKSGNNVIYAVVDSANSVKEFNEENNEASLSLNIPEIFHELGLDKPAYSAYEDVYITIHIINNKSPAIQGTLELKIINLSSMKVVWYSTEEISLAGAPDHQALSSFYNYNLGPNPEGEYRITQILTLDGEELIDEVIFMVLKTESVAGTFTLEPCVINSNQEEDVLVSADLQNRGNVKIEAGSLKLEIEKKDTGENVFETQIEFDLDIAESKNVQEWITLNLPEGFYTVKLLFDEEILDEQELEAKVQIEYTKEESLAPRVLILTGLKEKKPGKGDKLKGKKGKDWIYYAQLFLIEQALEEAGISYKIETKADDQIREVRSGTYNIFILLDDSKELSHIGEEIKERLWRGEGVIGILTDSDLWKKDFIKEIFGIEVKGKKEPKEKKKTVETYATPVSGEGEFTLESSFVELKPKAEELIIVGNVDKGKKPAMTLYHYGEGRAVASGFVLAASPGEPAHEALKQILLNSFSYLKPQKEKDAIISRVVPVELTFQNPASSAAQLRIEEEIPHEVKLISAEPEPDEKDSLSWTFTMEPSSSKNLRYEVELPDLKGEYQFKTSIIKVEGETEFLIDTSALSYSVEKTVRELISETITEIESLPLTSHKDRERVKKAVKSLARIQNRDETKRLAYHKNLFDTLSALKDVEEIETSDTTNIRRSLVDLMLYYERRTADEEKKKGHSSVVDLNN